MSTPVEYRITIVGFGTWKISYSPEIKNWVLTYNVRFRGEQWVPVGTFAVAEAAALAVADQKTGARGWDNLDFARPENGELSEWKTGASEGIQDDASS